MQKRTKLSYWLETVAWVLAGVLLIAAVLYYNVFNKATYTQGYAVGEQCPEFEVALYKTGANPDGGVLTPQSERGKVLVLNFWYISCGPCREELPHFEDVQREYAEEVTIVAIHSYGADKRKDKESFLAETYPDYTMLFGQDTEELLLFDKLGGGDSYPMTVILDKEGVIRYCLQGKVTKEELQSKVSEWL